MKYFTLKTAVAACAMALALFVSCETTGDGPEGERPIVTGDYHIAFANGSESISATLVQGVTNLAEGAISPTKGWELESSRTARVFSSADGSTIYSLNYTVGDIEKLTYHGGDLYKQAATTGTATPLGPTATRFTKTKEQSGPAHYISGQPQCDREPSSGHR